MFFSPKAVYPIGLDISDLTVKLVQFTRIRDKIKINAFGRVELGTKVMENGEIKNEEKLIKEIEKLISCPEYGKVDSDEVIACLPESQTFIKLISAEKKNRIEDAIKEEIEREIPFSINDLYYDYQLIEQKIDTNLILIGAAPKMVVDKFTGILDRLKLSVIALEIEPVSICRALLLEEGLKPVAREKNNYCIIDIGAKHASLTIYSVNSILFSISLPFSGEEVTETIALKIKLSRDQAEKAKIICGLDSNKAEGAVKNILSEELKKLTEKIKEGLDFFYTRYPERGAINKVILSGGGANIKELPMLLRSSLGIGVSLGNPFMNLEADHKNFPRIFIDKYLKDCQSEEKKKSGQPLKTFLSGQERSYATALGLALRDLFVNDL
ncbi:MAG: type IV pilus assembly protein PilM [Patescibacteria group bacterium]|jgi:type IV pilus assembly protein PilM